MNLLLLDPAEVDADGRAHLVQRRAEHLLRVLGVEPGQVIRAGLVDGPVGSAEILETTKRSVTLRFIAPETTASKSMQEMAGPSEGEVDLVVGLPRPQVLHRVLQTCASMTVRRLDLVNAWRVEKSFFQSPSLRGEKIRYQLLLGAEQGMSTRLPEVHQQRLLVPFLRSLGEKGDERHHPLRLIAHPDAEVDLEEAFWDTNGGHSGGHNDRHCGGHSHKHSGGHADRPVQIAIGPEGGWVDREVESFRDAGFRPVRLGRWILRVEVALAVALGQLAVARRRASAP